MADRTAGAQRLEIAPHAAPSLFLGIAVELAEQGVAVFLGPVGQVRDKTFDLFAGGLAEGFGAAEIDGVGLDEVGIELVLADQLTEAVANLGAAVVSVLSVDRLRRKLLRLPGGGTGSANEPISSTEQMPMP